MKIIIALLWMLVYHTHVYAQHLPKQYIENDQLKYDMLMKKYKTYKRIGVPLAIAGGSLVVLGGAVLLLSPLGGLSQSGGNTDQSNSGVKAIMAVGGGMVLASIPLLSSSKNNYRRAMSLKVAIDQNTLSLPNKNLSQNAISLRITF